MRDGIWRGAGRATLVFLIALVAPAGAQAATTDLGVTKSDSPDPVKEGQTLTYTLSVTNAGPGIASGVTVTDDLDNQLDFVSATASQGTCDRSGRKITCNIGTLQPAGGPYTEYAESATVTIRATPKKTGQLTNTARIRTIRKDIARILTIRHERVLDAELGS